MKHSCRTAPKLYLILSIAVLLSMAAAAKSQTAPAPLELLDVFQFEFAADPQISPDGSSVVYVRNYYDILTDRRRSELWVVGEETANQPFLPGSSFTDVSSPKWSPDGKRLAFVSRDDNGKSQIFCFWTESGKIGRLTNLTESPSGLSWSPDGRRLAFFMRVPGDPKPLVKMPAKPDGARWAEGATVISRLVYRADGRGYLPYGFTHLFVVSADGGMPRQLTTGDYNHGGGIAWLDSGAYAVIGANRRDDWEDQPNNTELFKVGIADGSIVQLTDRFGPDFGPAAAPDGTIAYLGFDDKLLSYHNSLIYLRNSAGSTRALTASLDRSAGPVAYDPRSKRWIFSYSDRGNTKLAAVDASGKITVLASDLGSNSNGRPYGDAIPVSVSEDGTIAFTVTGPDRAGDVAILKNGAVQRLTDLNADVLESRKLGKVTEINYSSSFDGTKIQGWYITPPDFDPSKKYPLILEIHGGPFADYGDRFTSELQLMAARGYVVLYTNPRGSTSYGADFANEIHHNYPGNDYDDLLSGVDAMIAKGFINEENLFVTGGSGGGVLTAWIVGKTDRFRAAVVAKPVINWYSFVLHADNPNFFYKYWFPGFPWEHEEHYMKRSPISLVGNVKTPTMLLTGEDDLRTPISETEQYYAALKLRKVDSVMVRIPGASHGIAARPSHLIAKVSHILAWFDRYRVQAP